MLGIDQPVIGSVRLAEHREARRRVRFQGNLPLSTITPPSVVPCPPMNLVSECTTMSAPCSIGRSRIGVATVLSTISGTPCAVRDLGHRLDVADVAGRIADAFAKHRAGVVVDQLLDVGGLVDSRRSAPSTPWLRQHMREQRMGGAVELRHGDDVAAGSATLSSA